MTKHVSAQATRPRCRCGVYADCHHPDVPALAHTPKLAGRLRLWLLDHSVSAHIIAPIWVRIPEKWRWRYANWLNRSQRFCWSSLVDAALTYREADACDVRTPSGCSSDICATTCLFFGHQGEHTCSCYCGKFEFVALDGLAERRERYGSNGGEES